MRIWYVVIENTGIFLYFIIKCDCGGIYIRVEYSASDWRKDVRDFNKVEQLFNRKKQLQEDLEELIEIYNGTSLSAKISGGITNLLSPKVKEQFGGMRKLFGMFSDAIIAKLKEQGWETFIHFTEEN